jgi:hypothetical protein
MKQFLGKMMVMAALVGALPASAADITIMDGQGSGTGWYSANRENNETEPGTITSQAWDLETMQLNGTKLSITGGYDFRYGTQSGGKYYRGGDILIDLNGDAKTMWTSGVTADRTLNSYFNYDFAIHFSKAANGAANSLTYTIIDLNSSSTFEQVTDIQKSNPWRVSDTSVYDSTTGSFQGEFAQLATDAEGAHYSLTVDLSNSQALMDAIALASKMLVKYTIECGNDTIIGETPLFNPSGSVADAGSTLALLGAAFGGFAAMGRRFGRRAAAE